MSSSSTPVAWSDCNCVHRVHCRRVEAHAHPSRPHRSARHRRRAGQASGRCRHVPAVADVHLDYVAADPLLELAGVAAATARPWSMITIWPARWSGLIEVLRCEQHIGPGLHERADRVPELHPAAGIEAGRRLSSSSNRGAPTRLAPRCLSLRRMPPEYVRASRSPASTSPSCSSTTAALPLAVRLFWPNKLAIISASHGRSSRARPPRTGPPGRSRGGPPRGSLRGGPACPRN